MSAVNTIHEIREYLKALNLRLAIDTVGPIAEDIASCINKEKVESIRDILLLENVSNSRKKTINTLCNIWDKLPWQYKLKIVSIFYIMAYVNNSSMMFVILMAICLKLQISHPEFSEYFKNE